jgi:hypothetical protein
VKHRRQRETDQRRRERAAKNDDHGVIADKHSHASQGILKVKSDHYHYFPFKNSIRVTIGVTSQALEKYQARQEADRFHVCDDKIAARTVAPSARPGAAPLGNTKGRSSATAALRSTRRGMAASASCSAARAAPKSDPPIAPAIGRRLFGRRPIASRQLASLDCRTEPGKPALGAKGREL